MRSRSADVGMSMAHFVGRHSESGLVEMDATRRYNGWKLYVCVEYCRYNERRRISHMIMMSHTDEKLLVELSMEKLDTGIYRETECMR